MQQFLRINDVTKTFTADSKMYQALRGVSLVIRAGEMVVISGKSGSGKSTLLNMTTGIDYPTSGSISVFGREIQDMKGGELARWRGSTVGIVFQFFQLMPTLTALENVMMPMEFASVIGRKSMRSRALCLLEKVEMAELADKFPQSLSGGEQQRVAIARALANDPPLLVADEPTGNLDSGNTRMIQDLFNGLVRNGKTVIYVTHEKDLHLKYSRRIVLTDGLISSAEGDGTPAAGTEGGAL